MICRADEHYTVVRRHGVVARLVCVKCSFAVNRESVSGANASAWQGGKSGTPRYNRMRGVMVRHIHAEHMINAGDREQEFDAEYARLAELGACDLPGGAEYQRVKSEWIAASRTGGEVSIEAFIRARANMIPSAR